MENFTQKDIVNRKQLLAEYNDNYTLDEDDNLILPSSTPGSNRKPISGHCLCFDSSNPNAYIQTSISSANRYNWRIVIKGEGSNATTSSVYRTLYVDDSGTNIAIRQMSSAVEADVFYLSYIAFVNITTNKVEHLFECEEGSGTILYDACTGDTATLENVTSISSLRVDSRTKEWISDEKNLDNEYHINKALVCASGVTASNFQDIPFPISLAIRFKAPQCPISQFTESILYWGTTWSASNYGIRITGFQNASKSLAFYYLNNTAASTTTNGISLANTDYVCDNKWHTFVFCVNSTYIKVYIDNILKGTLNKTFTQITSVPDALNLRISSAQYTQTTYKNWSHKDLLITNFDMSLDNAPYTVMDYENMKDIPTNVLLGTGTDKVWLQWQNMNSMIAFDGSPNKRHMSIMSLAYNGQSNVTPSKCFGTFYNQVGGTVDNGIIIPRKVIS